MEVIKNIEDMRRISAEKRAEGKIIGFVPTMGALHEGHLSLVRRALDRSDFVVVSIFVNPTQFGPHEDFNKYPRNHEDDMHKLESLGAHLIFAPGSNTIYPEDYSTYVIVEGITEGLCGRSRPVHFRGVATVVAKLFNIVMPHIAVFGQKDAQQLAVIRRMVRDLNMDIEIDAGPIIREPDGLAMSSRNNFLNPEEHRQATVLYRALCSAEELVKSGVTRSVDIIKKIHEEINVSSLARIEYIEIVHVENMNPVENISNRALLALAVRFGSTRLIDNVILKVSEGD
ncbi:pantoate--beta-alanine ligase [Candidatus Latescibacterota bacterium]